MTRIFLFAFHAIIGTGINCQAQGPTSYWHFGDRAGLHFQGYAPSGFLGNNLYMPEGCSSVSTSGSDLLYFARQDSCMDANAQAVSNGQDIVGFLGTTQGALFVPHPVDPSVHYLFTKDIHNTYVHTLQRTLAHPLGIMVPGGKNKLVYDSTSTRMTAVHHENGKDVWVITRRHWTGDSIMLAYLLTDTGLSAQPVTSIVDVGNWVSPTGQLKASFNGKYLAECFTNGAIINEPQFGLYRFDAATGKISDPIVFHDADLVGSYGVEFSPSNRYVYFSNGFQQQGFLYRFDLSVFDSASIAASKVVFPAVPMHSLQMGIDRKIYGTCSYNITDYLSRVENPDAPASSLVFTPQAVYLEGREALAGLPDFITSYFRQAYFDFTNACMGSEVQFMVRHPDADSVFWNFGDPASGPLNTSTSSGPTHVFTDTGTFTVTLTVAAGPNVDTFSRDVVIISPPVPFDLGDTLGICKGGTLDFDIFQDVPYAKYYWSGGSDSSGFSASDPGLYWATVYNHCDTLTDSVYLDEVDTLEISLGPDTSLCAGDTLTLGLGFDPAGATFRWWDNDTVSTEVEVGHWLADGSAQLTFWLRAENACGQVEDRLTVDFAASPEAALPDDTTVCDTVGITMEAADKHGVQYRWTDLATNAIVSNSSSVFVEHEKQLVLTSWNQCDTVHDTVSVSFANPIEIDLGADTIACPGDKVQLDVTWPGASYLWNTGSTGSMVMATEPGIYMVTVYTSDCEKSLEKWVAFADSACIHIECDVFVPNIITPNGDGLNDEFHVMAPCNQAFEIKIFNRWGIKIGESAFTGPGISDSSVNWDELPEGVFFYLVRSIDGDELYRGSFTLLR